jgi:hypothetical protein
MIASLCSITVSNASGSGYLFIIKLFRSAGNTIINIIQNESRLAALILEFFFMDTIQKLRATKSSDRTEPLKQSQRMLY